MFIITNYPLAVAVLVFTMLCWGSWPNLLRLTTPGWRFELFYWDYVLGLVLMSLLIAMTLGCVGTTGRSFFDDVLQADIYSLLYAALAGMLFNFGNLLFVAAINYSGMAVAFPVGGGLALLLGVISNYAAQPKGSALLLFCGMAMIFVAILISARLHYLKSKEKKNASAKGILLSILAGCFFGFFFRLVAAVLVSDPVAPEPGKITSYTALTAFALGAFISTIPVNIFLMKHPLSGPALRLHQYAAGSLRDHMLGLAAGAIWCAGLAGSLLASNAAGAAIAFGLSQANALVALLWGVFIWKEFKEGGSRVNRMLLLIFTGYLVGILCMTLSGNI